MPEVALRYLHILIAMIALAAGGPARAQTGTPVDPKPVDPRLGCDKAGAAPPVDLGEPDNIDLFKRRLLAYRCTAYENDIAEVLGKARQWVAARAGEVQRPAIVLDIDETSLFNWPRIYQDDYAYIPNVPGGHCDFAEIGDPCGDLDWQQSARAVAIGPTLQLYKLARCIDQAASCTKVEVFFVTGRREKAHNNEMASAWTLRNLQLAGFDGIARDHLYMRDPASTGSVSIHKTAARTAIEAKGFVIIANVGDQKSDLVGDDKGAHAEMIFKVPNPFYFID
ncbi:HAD family acid phosphatase [Bradyrhizobium sp. INPA03-11B]|uniref:HAD family acid phosphatase n=1 Tax=Bradyrhizobium sp. INPA03-11B TaxID=418598 RepID=UPI00338D6227